MELVEASLQRSLEGRLRASRGSALRGDGSKSLQRLLLRKGIGSTRVREDEVRHHGDLIAQEVQFLLLFVHRLQQPMDGGFLRCLSLLVRLQRVFWSRVALLSVERILHAVVVLVGRHGSG